MISPKPFEIEHIEYGWEKRVQSWYKSNRIVPIVGAGLSCNFELPSWEQIVTNIKDEIKKEFGDIDVKTDNTELTLSTYRLLSFLNSTNDKALSNIILYKSLYETFKISEEGIWWLECLYFLTSCNNSYYTLNFDDIFEQYILNIRNKNLIINTLDERFESPSIKNAYKLYHVHGLFSLIQNEKSIYSDPKIVFDFFSYIERYAEFIDRLSVNLLNTFLYNNCVFLGLSMEDPNLLRIIMQAWQIRKQNGDTDPWGIVFIQIDEPYLKKMLNSLGLLVVDIMSEEGDKNDFTIIPRRILNAICSKEEYTVISDSIDNKTTLFKCWWEKESITVDNLLKNIKTKI